MPIVRMPDGTQVSFPDDMPKEQIKGMIASKYPDAINTQPQGFLANVNSDLQQRAQNVIRDAGRADRGEIMPSMAGLSYVGNTAGLGVDVLGRGLSAVTPDFVKEGAKNVLSSALDTDLGRKAVDAAGYVGDKYSEFAKANPNADVAARAVGNVGNFVTSLMPVKSAASAAAYPVTTAAGYGEKLGEALVKSGKKSLSNQKDDFLQGLITPKNTEKVRRAQFENATEKGILRQRVVEPTSQEAMQMQALRKTAVSPRKSLLGNYNVVQKEIGSEAEKLAAALSRSDATITRQELTDTLMGVRQNVQDNPYFVGDGGAAADKVFDVLMNKIPDGDLTASQALDLRKGFDAEVKRLKGSKAFNPTTDSAVTDAILQTRQAVNQLIADKVPDAGVRQSLQKQSSLYRAADAISSKGANEADNALKRVGQAAYDMLPGNNMFSKGGATAAALGMGAISMPALATAAGLYGAGKAVASPYTRVAIGNVMKGISNPKQLMVNKLKGGK